MDYLDKHINSEVSSCNELTKSNTRNKSKIPVKSLLRREWRKIENDCNSGSSMWNPSENVPKRNITSRSIESQELATAQLASTHLPTLLHTLSATSTIPAQLIAVPTSNLSNLSKSTENPATLNSMSICVARILSEKDLKESTKGKDIPLLIKANKDRKYPIRHARSDTGVKSSCCRHHCWELDNYFEKHAMTPPAMTFLTKETKLPQQQKEQKYKLNKYYKLQSVIKKSTTTSLSLNDKSYSYGQSYRYNSGIYYNNRRKTTIINSNNNYESSNRKKKIDIKINTLKLKQRYNDFISELQSKQKIQPLPISSQQNVFVEKSGFKPSSSPSSPSQSSPLRLTQTNLFNDSPSFHCKMDVNCRCSLKNSDLIQQEYMSYTYISRNKQHNQYAELCDIRNTPQHWIYQSQLTTQVACRENRMCKTKATKRIKEIENEASAESARLPTMIRKIPNTLQRMISYNAKAKNPCIKSSSYKLSETTKTIECRCYKCYNEAGEVINEDNRSVKTNLLNVNVPANLEADDCASESTGFRSNLIDDINSSTLKKKCDYSVNSKVNILARENFFSDFLDSKLVMRKGTRKNSRTLNTLNLYSTIILLVHLTERFFGCWQQLSLRSRRTNKEFTTAKWFLCMTLIAMIASVNCYGGRNDVPTNCTFPAHWEGSWFLSGYQQSIHIKGSQFSYRGRCAASEGNKYLIVDEKGCHRCLVIYEKHSNVLQYKESECEGDSIYQSNPSALAMRSVLKQSDHRGGAHPNLNGHSRLSSSDQFILRSNDDMNDCPPDFCKGRETLQNLCDQIPGDALLYSLFRENAEAVKCPLKGPFIFTYNRGHGECKSPVSNIESCTEDSRLLLSFQACPDIQGTESTVEELTCLATWKDGNSRYLVGLVSHHHAISNEERYRCFVYEKISPLLGGPSMMSPKDAEYKLAQSGDATCNGLDSAEVGSRIMSLRKPPNTVRCDFPVWFKGPRHWHGLMGNFVYNYHTNDGSIHIIKPNGYMETRALCEQINKLTSTEVMAVVHYTTGCQSGFMCMMFYRRDTHVIEIQSGKPAIRLEDACAPDHFDVHKMPYITLLASSPDPQICPMEGLYNLRGAIGPPYMTTRHKRNHSNKVHNAHSHHRVNEEKTDGSHPVQHKKHNTFSYRSADKGLEQSSWHGSTRGLPMRNRRSPLNAAEGHLLIKNAIVNETAIDLVLRNRRNTPLCITNVNSLRQLWVGCTEPNVIDVRPLCNDEGDEEYSCHGTWNENGTVHIVARHKGTKHGVCISYRPTEGNAAKLYIGDTCYRGYQKPPDHILEASLSVYGKCGETHSSSSTYCSSNSFLLLSMAFVMRFADLQFKR